MAKVSVIVPARNESYLTPTVNDVLTKTAGEVECVVVLEAYEPDGWKDIQQRWSNLHTVYHAEPKGMRASINEAAASAISRGTKYLLKLDAHCLVDEGWDEKLKADCDTDWVVVPRRKRLDADNWTIQETGKLDIDYHYLSFPDDPADFGGPGLNGKVWEQRIRERLNNPDYDVDDEMSSQGSCWFMHADYFQYLELMDEASYGPFWNEFQEVGMKCWLSGGQVKVNKRTFYAHLHKGRTYKGADGKGGRGYHLPESWLKQGAGFTRNWIWNDAKFSKQTRPFEWLIDHFWPVPTWKEDWREVLYKDRKPRVVGIPQPKEVIPVDDTGEKIEGAQPSLRIHSARYGITGDSIDVTDKVRSLVKDNSLDIVVNNFTLAVGNPYRGKRKVLLVSYSYDGAEPITVERSEKDWLIIGQAQRTMIVTEVEQGDKLVEWTDIAQWKEAEVPADATVKKVFKQIRQSLTATALNDYLIRKFSIPAQRLRGPMPIELRDFHRNDLAVLFAELGFSKGAEVGVAEANYSEVLLKANPSLELHMVDPWHSYLGNPQNKSKEKNEFAYNEMLRKTKGYKMAFPIMDTSMEYVRNVVDSSLDFVYIDGHHGFDYVMQDLIEWSKKVRSGGLITGDDMLYLDEKRWGAGPIEAVTAYVKAHRIATWFIFQGHKSVDFAWVKP